MAIRRKGNAWQVDVTFRGVRAPRLSAKSEAEARTLEAQLLQHLQSGQPVDSVRKLFAVPSPVVGTLRELVLATRSQRWAGSKSESTAVMNAEAWCLALGHDFPVEDVTSDVAAEICDEWAAQGNAPATINRKLAALSVMLKVAEERGAIVKVPRLPRRREYEGRLRYFSDAEVEDLISRASHDASLRNLYIVAVETGMRLGELQGLIVRDVDFERTSVALGKTKSNRRRALPATTRALRALEAQCRGKIDHEAVFPARLTSRFLSRMFAAWKEERGLPASDEACFHTFRHTTCSRLVQRGVPIYVVQQFMGHKVLETTMRYAHLAPDSLLLAKKALEKPSGKGRQTLGAAGS